MVNVSRKAGLGRTLQKAQKYASQRRNPRKKSVKHTTDLQGHPGPSKVDLRSVTAQTNLDEFFEEAELAGKQFITERRNLAVLNDNETSTNLYNENERIHEKKQLKLEDIDLASSLSVPRRPKWDSSTTPEQLDELERLTFLAWRKKLATLQEIDNATLTPFEKNLEVWRQLWRVIERSDIVVQILDCRNPLLYLCDDLIKYVHEEFNGKKLNLLLLNKADYLTKEQRHMWADYFRSRNIDFMYFSALQENNHMASNRVASEDETTSNDDVIERLENNLNLKEEKDESHIYDKFELLDSWRGIIDGPLTVGLVGYPNVGKSSTINALLSAKRVAVSATPGKTKHFQTFLVDKDMMLCDCPGLVFPNFVSSKSEMIINGILPIDQMKDYVGPVRIIVDRIPRGYLEEIYGLAFEQDAKQNISADDLLNSFGFMRGYMTARGLPDISRAARKVCKDYINGKILYCVPPPGIDQRLYHSHSKLADAMRRIEQKGDDRKSALQITERQRRLMMQAKGTDISSKQFDAQYIQGRTGNAHIRGLPGIGNMTQPIGRLSDSKVPKGEKKHKKREKLRRVYRDLDI